VVEIPLRRKLVEDGVADEVPETQQTNGTSNGIEEEATDESQNTTSTNSPKNAKNHIRFGSEEPAPVLNGAEEIPETQPVPPEEEASSDDDDEAPEVVDNSAQLLSLKVQAQKQEEARKRSVMLPLICAKHKF
jgi:U3 small nucleolar RNA-associated protein 16